MSGARLWALLSSMLLVGGMVLPTLGASNFAPGQSYSWAPNLGWADWRGDGSNGVELGQYICSGSVYFANVGWISLGSGAPADGVYYRNKNSADFGVNVDSIGQLRGLAYGANVGWIQFEDRGAPRVDLSSGKLSGFAYGANVGWMDLGSLSFPLAVRSITAGADRDQDGIPDAWELVQAGDLGTLGPGTDFDQDGQSDLEEYQADTDPLDERHLLHLLNFSIAPDRASVTLAWSSQPTRQYQIEVRDGFSPGQAWTESGLGLQTSDAAVITRTVPARPSAEFFRIRAVRALSP